MLRKERKEQQRGKLMYVISDHIQKEVAKHRMNGAEADEWYTDFMDIFPTFKYAVDEPSKVKSQVKLKKALIAKHPNWTAKILQFRPRQKKEEQSTQQLMHVHVM